MQEIVPNRWVTSELDACTDTSNYTHINIYNVLIKLSHFRCKIKNSSTHTNDTHLETYLK